MLFLHPFQPGFTDFRNNFDGYIIDYCLHPVAEQARLVADRPDDGAMPMQLLRR
jgi:hypothetical protein